MKLEVIEEHSKDAFKEAVTRFLATHACVVESIKFQRNLFYSLSGSTHYEKERVKETSTLKESYVAFILYRDYEAEVVLTSTTKVPVEAN